MIRCVLLLACCIVCLLTTQAFAHDHAVLRGRLVFSYADRPAIGVFDLDSGDVTHRFDVPNPDPRMVLGSEGRYVYVLTGDSQGTVRILDVGLTFDSHGDHIDVEKGAVKLLDFAITGVRPSHVNSAPGWTVVFFDGRRGEQAEPSSSVSARAVAIDVASLARTKPVALELQTAGPQHGLAVPLGERIFAVSAPNPAYTRFEANSGSLPVGVILRAAGKSRPVMAFDGSTTGNPSCPQMHGHAAVGRTHVFGCGGERDAGILVLRKTGRSWKGAARAYPDSRRVSTLRAHDGARFAIGNYGTSGNYRALIRIALQSDATLREADVFAIPGDQGVCQFAVREDKVVNLTPDGKLRIYQFAPAWSELASFDAVAPFDCAFDAREPKPAIAVLGDRVFVSDPKQKRIREFDLKSLKQGLDLPIDGAPGHLAAAD
jgi:hypothetical protein